MSDQSVLPKNSSLLETGIEKAFRELIYEPGNPFPSLLRPSETPDRMLPYVSRDRGVDKWYDEAESYQDNRRLASDIWSLRSAVGTRAAIKRAVNLLGMETEFVKQGAYKFGVVVRAVEPPSHENLVGEISDRVELTKSERSVFDVTIAMDTKVGQAQAVCFESISQHEGETRGRSRISSSLYLGGGLCSEAMRGVSGQASGRSKLRVSAYWSMVDCSSVVHVLGVIS